MKRLITLLLLLAGSCTTVEERVQEVLDRYWTAGEWVKECSEENIHQNHEQIEERFVRWIRLLELLPTDEAGPRLQKWLQELEATAIGFNAGWELTEKHLYSPLSPLRDDELYIYALEEIVRSPHIDSYTKLRPRFQLNMARRNRPGTAAADFAMTLSDGTAQRLHDIDAPLTLLIFSDPECEDCRQKVKQLRQNGWIRLAELCNELQIVAVYSDTDEVYDKWEEYAATLPDRWIKARDEGARLHYDGLYDLRATPALYLLDTQKRVLVKGAASLPPITRQLRHTLLRGKQSEERLSQASYAQPHRGGVESAAEAADKQTVMDQHLYSPNRE